MTLFAGKNDSIYTNLKDSIPYQLEVSTFDPTYSSASVETVDVDWKEMDRRFPGFIKVFHTDGSGLPSVNLYIKSLSGRASTWS